MKVSIQDIKESLYDAYLDSEYREAFDNTLMALGYVKYSPSYLYYGTQKQKAELIKVETKPLTSNQISEIMHLMMYKMRDDFQYGEFKKVAIEYIDISEKMKKQITEKTTSNQEQEKPKADFTGVSGYMFEMIGKASIILKQNNMHDESREMVERATTSYSYDDAYKIIEEYIEIVKEAVQEDEEEFE